MTFNKHTAKAEYVRHLLAWREEGERKKERKKERKRRLKLINYIHKLASESDIKSEFSNPNFF